VQGRQEVFFVRNAVLKRQKTKAETYIIPTLPICTAAADDLVESALLVAFMRNFTWLAGPA
jgi:hypothetical protein